MKIQEIDKNFDFATSLTRKDIAIYNVLEEPFKIYGLILPKDDNDSFHRLPYEVAESVNPGVKELNLNTSGGRVRFSTDSDYIAIRAEIHTHCKVSFFSFTGIMGFDLYVEEDGKQKFVRPFIPSLDAETSYEAEITTVEGGKMRDYTINFPAYSGVKSLYVILNDKAKVQSAREYTKSVPVLYYGSSITQGGICSRPGNIYQNIISRRLDCDYVNLGFSASAKGETEIAEYISKQKMSVFVYDYDHNAPTVEHLENSHESMFKIIRSSQPELPIICVSRPDYAHGEDAQKRREVIMKTVENAKALGDKNVCFVDGGKFCEDFGAGDSISVDSVHPNDLGFMCMANHIGAEIDKILNGGEYNG